MSLLDGDKPSSLPSLSWDSVVGDKPPTQPPSQDGEPGDQPATSSPPEPSEPASPMAPPPAPPSPVPSAPEPAAASAPVEDPTGPIHLGVPVETAPPEGVGAGLLSVTPPEPVVETPPPTAATTGGLGSFQMSLERSMPAEAPAAEGVQPPVIAAPAIEPTAVAVSEPAQVEAPPNPVDAPAPAPSAPVQPTQAVPAAAPVPAATPAPAPAPAPGAVPEPAVAAAPAPAAPAPAYTLPPSQALSVPVATVGQQVAYGSPPPTGSRRRRRNQHRGGGLGLILTLLVLGGLIAAAFVYGRPYLFPDDWDETTKPYAEAVETVRGEPIVEPFSVVDDELVVYNAGFDADYFGEWETEVPMWRAFGLADAQANAAGLSAQLTARPDVYYSLSDRQVHRLATADPASIDSQTAATVAAAVLDQEYRWTLLLGESTVERDALVRALVATEADRIQASSDLGGSLPPASTPDVGLPVVLDHRLVAPSLYAAVIGPPTVTDESRLAELETYAAGLPGSVDLPLGTPAVLGEGEAPAGTALAMDRSFWYLVFASRMDAAAAHDYSQLLQSSSLTAVRTADLTTCWSAVFDVPSAEWSGPLASVLSGWAEAAPPTTAASVSTLSETAVQLRVCDPGIVAATTNPAAARSLLGYRAAELAVIAGITDQGGGQVEIDAGLALLAQSSIGDELAALPAMTEVSALAAEARTRAVPIVDAATAGLPAQPATSPAPTVGEEPVAVDEN